MGKLIIYGGDIDEFLRCPYRLIKCKCEEIRPITLLNSEYVKEVLMKAGLEFEDKVTSQVEWQESTEPIEILLKRKAVIKHPVIELEGSQIIEKGFHYDFSDILFVGCPDMIVPDGKKSYSPLDIKNHKEVTRMDRLRISYYAFLLKFRFNMDLSKGFVLLKDEIIEEIDAQEAYEEVMKIIFKISEAKRGNPNIQYQPQRCEECQNCSLQFECLSVLKDGEDLTLLYGIGPARAERLKRAGIKNIKQLSEINPDNLKFWCSKNFLRKLQLCAKSFSENKIIKIGDIEVPQENIVYFDIETDLACERVWMIGYSYKGEFKQLYADNWEQEKHIITEFFDFLKYLDSPILFSYSGSSFDLNVILKAASRLNLDAKFLDDIFHYDVCTILRLNYLFPIQNYKLKELGKFLGYPFKHDDLDGLRVAIKYLEHLETKKKLPKKVFDYNRDDVLAIPFMIEALKNRKDFLSVL